MKSKDRIFGIKADWKALFFCVLTASTFWFFNAMNRDYTDEIYYPFEIRYDESRVMPLTETPDKIKINVTGVGWNLLRKHLGFSNDPVIFHPGNLPQANFVSSSQLSPLFIKHLGDLRLNYILKDTIYFKFDYLKTKKVKLWLDSQSIGLAPYYKITSPIIISPDSAVFQGPSSYVKSIPDSLKITIPRTGIKNKFEEQVKIAEHAFQYVKLANKQVKIRFDVSKFEHQSQVLELKLLNFPSSYPVNFDKKIILTYLIKENDKNKVNVKDFEVDLDYNTLDQADSTITPKLIKKPTFVKEHYFTPYAVKISVRK
ncbi:MAG: hypothetical protein K2X86_02665 [Cytophagaceae bacterium]|nr:hypothetical protein [Cytophagaceae bacterium]